MRVFQAQKFKLYQQLHMLRRAARFRQLLIAIITLLLISLKAHCQLQLQPNTMFINSPVNLTLMLSNAYVGGTPFKILVAFTKGFTNATDDFVSASGAIQSYTYDHALSTVTIIPKDFQPSNYNITMKLVTPATQKIAEFSVYLEGVASVYFIGVFNVTACNKSSYLTSAGACSPCSSNCLTCSGSSSNCTSCSNGDCPQSGVCVNKLRTSCCSDGFYLEIFFGACIPCNATMGCLTCSRVSRCNSCLSGTFLANYTCISCSASCSGCFGSADNCTACATNYIRASPSLGSPCIIIPNCTGSTFLNGSVCSPCNSSCPACQYTSLYCTSCLSSFFLENRTCTQCDISCLQCTNIATNCTKCANGYINNGIQGSCVKFVNCDASCLQCIQSQNNCTICQVGYKNSSQLPGICLKTICKDGFFIDGSQCQRCDSSCLTCNLTATFCLSCNTSFFLTNNTCNKCDQSCVSCELSAEQCIQCSIGYNKSTSRGPCSRIICVDGFFLNGSNCQRCDSSCKTCNQTALLCTSCIDSYFLQNNTCLLCDKSCKSCTKSLITCSECAIGFHNITALPSICEQTLCPARFFPIQEKCLPCSSSCFNCSVTSTNCTSCPTNLPHLISNRCQPCPFSQFQDFMMGVCIPCSSTCLTCVRFFSRCTRCKNGTFLYEFKCLAKCPSGFFGNSSNICQAIVLTSSSMTVPPASVAFVGLSSVAIVSKAAISKTLLVSSLCAFAGIMQTISWVLMISFSFSGMETHEGSLIFCIYAIILAIFLNMVFNVINMRLFHNGIFQDQKFTKQYRLVKHSKTKFCCFYTLLVITFIFSHKFIEIFFSNLCRMKICSFKIKSIHKLNPQKYIRICSLVPSLIAIGSSIPLLLSGDSQSNGYLYWQSLDIIIISAISAIATLWVLRRKPQDYQNSLDQQNLEDLDIGDDPAPQIHFQQLKKDSSSQQSHGHNIQSYKHSINITEQNLFKKHEQTTQEHLYNQILVVPREKDEPAELKQTRLTEYASIRKKTQNSTENSKHSNSIDQEIPPIHSVRQAKDRRKMSRSRQRNKVFLQEERRPPHWLQLRFSADEIQAIKVIRQSDQVAAIVDQTIKEQLRTSQHRLKPNRDPQEVYAFLMNLNDNEVGVLDKNTRQTLQAIQQALLRLLRANIKPQEFLQQLPSYERIQSQLEKENRTPNNMPPLLKHLRTGKRRNRSNNQSIGSNGSYQRQKSQLRDRTPIYRSPEVGDFTHSISEEAGQFEQFFRQANNVRNPPAFPRQRKTPQSFEVEQEIKQSDNQDVQSTLRPYQAAVSPFHHKRPQSSSAKEHSPQQKQQRIEMDIHLEDDVHLSDGLSSLKKESELKQKMGGSPFISLSRVQEMYKCESFTFNQPFEAEMNAEFAGGDSVAQVMNRYSKNCKQSQEGGQEIPDEDEDMFKRIRRKKAARKRTNSSHEQK